MYEKYRPDAVFVYFGNQTKSFNPEFVKQITDPIVTVEPFKSVMHKHQISQLIFQHQVHGNQGMVISSYDQIKNYRAFSVDGDFLITDIPGIGLGVTTADCLPIIFYDPENKAIGIVHAGWKGTIAGITIAALRSMQHHFGTNFSLLNIFFGPSAGVCCYRVSSEFKKNIPAGFDQTLQYKNDQWFFDLLLFNCLQLEQAGVPRIGFNFTYQQCTIENRKFCSYRRDVQNPLRQMNIVSLTSY